MTNRIRVRVKGEVLGSVKPSTATDAAMRNCIMSTHHLLLLTMSTKGLQSGLIIHGSPMMLVSRARVPLGIPRSLNTIREMVFTMKYGRPSMKYNEGTHNQGFLTDDCIFVVV